MPYNPDAMTIIVSGDLPPEMEEKLRSQLTADVLTSKELQEREKALAMQEEVEKDTEENREAAGLTEEGDDFKAPDESEVDNVEITDTSDDTAGDGTETDGLDDTESGDESTDPEGSEETSEETKEPETGEESESEEEGPQVDDEADQADVTEEEAAEKDELDEPNAAFEHASSIGPKEVGRYLRLGVAKYKRRVRRLRKGLNLAQETLQMEAAQRQKMIRRLLYVKPTDSGFTSKLQTFISSINNPNDWIALVDTEGATSTAQELTTKQITEALNKAGIQMFENVETLADTFNQAQKAITEPEGSGQDNQDDMF